MFQFANVEAKRSPLGLFNDVINTGCLESSWRHAMFVMWPKSGDWPDVNTWRPIARLKIKDDFFFQCFTCGSLSRQTTIYNRGWQLSLSLGLSSRLSPALCPSSGLVAVSASLGLSPTSSPILSPSWSRMLCQLFRFFPYLELFFHIVWDVAFAFLGFPPSFSSVLSPILCEMPCPPCCPSACLRHLSLSLSPVLCPSSHLVFHFCLPLEMLRSRLDSMSVWDAVFASCLRSCFASLLSAGLGCDSMWQDCVWLAYFDAIVRPAACLAGGHRKRWKQDLRKLDIKLDAFGGLSWCAPWHHIVHDIVHVGMHACWIEIAVTEVPGTTFAISKLDCQPSKQPLDKNWLEDQPTNTWDWQKDMYCWCKCLG